MIVLVPGLFRTLPQAALAAVVITASLSLADLAGTRRLWHQRKVEFTLSMVAFAGVALLGVLPGILIAVGLSILNVFRHAWRPYSTTLGRVDGLAGHHDVRSYPDAEHLPGLTIYRFDAPLLFANAKTFRDEVLQLARTEPPPRWIVVAAEPITDVDTTASDVLFELDHLLDERGQNLVFAELKDPVRRKIERYGLTRAIEPRHFFPTVETAVKAFRAETGADWTTPPRRSRSGREPPRHRPAGTRLVGGPRRGPRAAGQLRGPRAEEPRVTRRTARTGLHQPSSARTSELNNRSRTVSRSRSASSIRASCSGAAGSPYTSLRKRGRSER